jgi:modulator of FtsH protease HflC
MRKILFAIIALLALCACDSASPVFTVMTGSEAIVTRKGEIVRGPVEPGLHFKWPFLETVYEFQMIRIETIPMQIPGSQDYTATIFWSIQNSKVFFHSTRNKDIQSVILENISDKFKNTLKNVDTERIASIAKGQEIDCNYTDDIYENIMENIQIEATTIGVNIDRIAFEKVNAPAQPIDGRDG